MLKNPGVKATPLKDVLLETFTMVDVSESIPRFIKKAQRILRREANMIRRKNGIEELDVI